MAQNSKARYGEGSIFQTGDGRWRGVLHLRNPAANKGSVKYFYGASKTEVQRKLRAYKNDPLNYSGQKATTADAADYFRFWLKNYKQPSLKPGSYDRIDRTCRIYIEPVFRGIEFRNITSDDCNKLLISLRDQGLSYSTTKKVYDAMAECFRYSVKKQELSHSPMDVVKLPSKSSFASGKAGYAGARHLTEEEEKALLSELNRVSAANGIPVYRYRDAFILLLNTGMREGELVALDWDDVDFEAEDIYIHKNAVIVQKRNASGEVTHGVEQKIQFTPKTSSSVRHIPMNKAAKAAVERLKIQAGDSPYLLPTQTGARIVAASLRKQYQNITSHCGIKGTSLHSLRHTFATRLFEKGADVKDVSVLLGHSSTGITYNTYIHVIKERKSDVVHLLDQE